jgi:DNA-binding XRE family transcriptional regulator
MDKLTVRQWRVMNDLTQEVMAEKLGIHINTYRNKEKGKLQWTAKEISMILDISKLEYSQLVF